VILAWTAVRPSVREGRLRFGALLLAAASVALLGAALVLADPRHPALLAAALTAAALAPGWAMLRRSRRPDIELAIDPTGAVRLRAAASGGDAPAHAAFAAPWLITFQSGAIWVPIWPDSVPNEANRRLSACVHGLRAEPALQEQQR
jgi:hypothetical protein